MCLLAVGILMLSWLVVRILKVLIVHLGPTVLVRGLVSCLDPMLRVPRVLG